jgi:hypothetical protein
MLMTLLYLMPERRRHLSQRHLMLMAILMLMTPLMPMVMAP